MGDAAQATYPVGSNGATQAIIEARRLCAALRAQAILRANRGKGPDAVMPMVKDRCGGVLTRSTASSRTPNKPTPARLCHHNLERTTADPWPHPAGHRPTIFTEFCVMDGPALELGNDGFAKARSLPILGSTVRGPGLNGTILPHGADEGRIRADSQTHIHTRYVIMAADGALIRVDSQGLHHGPLSRLGAHHPARPQTLTLTAAYRMKSSSFSLPRS